MNFTEMRSKIMGQRHCIERHSAESKSTWDKGLEAEKQVIRLLQKQGYKILQHRFQTPFAELDILTQGKRNQLVIIEVKARTGNLNDQPVVSEFQKTRLRRSALWLIEQGNEVELWLAVVHFNQRIQFFQDVFD